MINFWASELFLRSTVCVWLQLRFLLISKTRLLIDFTSWQITSRTKKTLFRERWVFFISSPCQRTFRQIFCQDCFLEFGNLGALVLIWHPVELERASHFELWVFTINYFWARACLDLVEPWDQVIASCRSLVVIVIACRGFNPSFLSNLWWWWGKSWDPAILKLFGVSALR